MKHNFFLLRLESEARLLRFAGPENPGFGKSGAPTEGAAGKEKKESDKPAADKGENKDLIDSIRDVLGVRAKDKKPAENKDKSTLTGAAEGKDKGKPDTEGKKPGEAPPPPDQVRQKILRADDKLREFTGRIDGVRQVWDLAKKADQGKVKLDTRTHGGALAQEAAEALAILRDEKADGMDRLTAALSVITCLISAALDHGTLGDVIEGSASKEKDPKAESEKQTRALADIKVKRAALNGIQNPTEEQKKQIVGLDQQIKQLETRIKELNDEHKHREATAKELGTWIRITGVKIEGESVVLKDARIQALTNPLVLAAKPDLAKLVEGLKKEGAQINGDTIKFPGTILAKGFPELKKQLIAIPGAAALLTPEPAKK